MRIAELATRTGATQAQVRTYLRHGWLPQGVRVPGRPTEFDRRHVHRVRVITLLRESGRASDAVISDITAALDADGAFEAQPTATDEPGDASQTDAPRHAPDVVQPSLGDVDADHPAHAIARILVRSAGWHHAAPTSEPYRRLVAHIRRLHDVLPQRVTLHELPTLRALVAVAKELDQVHQAALVSTHAHGDDTDQGQPVSLGNRMLNDVVQRRVGVAITLALADIAADVHVHAPQPAVDEAGQAGRPPAPEPAPVPNPRNRVADAPAPRSTRRPAEPQLPTPQPAPQTVTLDDEPWVRIHPPAR